MKKKNLIITLLIAQTFLWTGTAYLSVLFRLYGFFSEKTAFLLTEVLYYLLQAAGIFSYSFLFSRNPQKVSSRVFVIPVILLSGCAAVLALTLPGAAATAVSGAVLNFLIGVLSGIYLTRLSSDVPKAYRGRVFGYSYAAGSIGTWLLSLPVGGKLLEPLPFLPLLLFLVLLSVFLTRFLPACPDGTEEPDAGDASPDAGLIALAMAVPFVFSLISGLGGALPYADLSVIANPVFQRLFYAAGLILAGHINDLNRRYGAVLCAASLVFPFICLLLRDQPELSLLLGILRYIFFGFFAVYRIVLFADLPDGHEKLRYLAVFGLAAGRIGDAIGGGFGYLYQDRLFVLIACSGAAFACAVMLLFSLDRRLYAGKTAPEPSSDPGNASPFGPGPTAASGGPAGPSGPRIEYSEDGGSAGPFGPRIERFEAEYGFTSRQCEILRRTLDGATNAEISSALFISESTVKYHMRNILTQTGCKNRTELQILYKNFR